MKTTKNKKGFTLVEVLLTLGAVTVLSASIYLALKPTSATAQVRVEQDNLNSLSTAIDRSFGLLGTYGGDPVTGAGGVTTARIIADGLAPRRMVSGASLLTDWGTSAAIASAAVARPGDAFTITYPATPAEVCAKLAAAVSNSVYDLKVGGSSVMAAGSLDPTATAEQCSHAGGAHMVFIYHSGLVSGTVVATMPSLTLPPAPPGAAPPSSSPIATPAGPASPAPPPPPTVPIVPGVGSPSPSAPSVPPPPAATTPPPPPVPAPAPAPAPAPSGAPQACQATSTTQTQTLHCEPQLGTWTQRRTVSTTCAPLDSSGNPLYYIDPATGLPASEAWNPPKALPPSPWVDVVNTCAPACIAPAPSLTPQTQTVPESALCPGGQIGSDTWTQNQSRTQSVVHVCSTPVGPVVDQPATYTAWANVGGKVGEVNTCASTCAAGPAYFGTQGTASPVLLQVGTTTTGLGAGFPNVSSVSYTATAAPGRTSGAYKANVTYMGQTVSISVSCVAPISANGYCEAYSPATTVGGGTFEVYVNAQTPIKGQSGSGPWTAHGWTYQLSSAPGCGGTATPVSPIRIQF